VGCVVDVRTIVERCANGPLRYKL